ncbi:MAG TPA: hypothetical protein VFS79_02560 [Arthrobacter sp.]|nr:hypothetical protein [Arthrobacter sp.]
MVTRNGHQLRSGSTAPPELIPWLLEGDPAIRWQVLQDLVGAPAADVSAEQDRVAREGWGARLLGEQDDGGTWAQGLYLPKWTSTTYTLLLLQRLGLPGDNLQAMRGCQCLWDGATYFGGGPSLWHGPPDTCVAGMLVLLASCFKYGEPRLDTAVSWLVREQLPDGGWNCQAGRKGSRHGSFHTTITVLEALLAYRRAGGSVDVRDASSGGEAFFLAHHLYRSHRTGEIVNESFARFPFPPQWHFDVLRGLEYFRASGAACDPSLQDAVDGIRGARNQDGLWKRPPPYPGNQWFTLEPPGASRIATLRCLRVLRWWDSDGGTA